MKYVVSQTELIHNLLVTFSDGSFKKYDLWELTKFWFEHSNDYFYETYGFNYVPNNYLYHRYQREREKKMNEEIQHSMFGMMR